MQGIKLSTGETVGAWSLDVIDGKRDDSLEPSAAHDAGAVSSATAEASADADTFGNRMMENLYYMKMKAKLKADEALKANKGKKKEGKKKALPVPSAPTVIPEATVSDKGGEVSASVGETNRVRALLGMKPLHGTAPALLPAAASNMAANTGPQLPSRLAEATGAPGASAPAPAGRAAPDRRSRSRERERERGGAERKDDHSRHRELPPPCLPACPPAPRPLEGKLTLLPLFPAPRRGPR